MGVFYSFRMNRGPPITEISRSWNSVQEFLPGIPGRLALPSFRPRSPGAARRRGLSFRLGPVSRPRARSSAGAELLASLLIHHWLLPVQQILQNFRIISSQSLNISLTINLSGKSIPFAAYTSFSAFLARQFSILSLRKRMWPSQKLFCLNCHSIIWHTRCT